MIKKYIPYILVMVSLITTEMIFIINFLKVIKIAKPNQDTLGCIL